MIITLMSPHQRSGRCLPALSRPLPPDSALTGAARPAWAPRAERENLRREPGPEPQGEGDTGGGGHRSGGAIGQRGSQWSSLSKNVEFQE